MRHEIIATRQIVKLTTFLNTATLHSSAAFDHRFQDLISS